MWVWFALAWTGLRTLWNLWTVVLVLLVVVVGLFALLDKSRPLTGVCEWTRVTVTQRVYQLLVGHGYARWRALAWIGVLIVVGWVVFNDSPMPRPDGLMQPTQSLALRAWSGQPPEPWVSSLPAYNPLIYSADTLIPLMNFHQEGYWMPSSTGAWGWFVKNVYLPLHISLGWIIATLFVASFTRLMRQED